MTSSSGRLQGKTALVTGSTRGLGRTTAEWLAQEGVNVVVSGREADAVARSVDAIEALGVQAVGITADLARSTKPIAWPKQRSRRSINSIC